MKNQKQKDRHKNGRQLWVSESNFLKIREIAAKNERTLRATTDIVIRAALVNL